MMNDFQQEKALIRAFHADLHRAGAADVAEVLARYAAPDWHWRGMHPFHEQSGPRAVAETFWAPLLAAFSRLQRRPDIFIAGLNEIDGFKGRWVVEMGHAPICRVQPCSGRAGRRDRHVLRHPAPDDAGGAESIASADRRDARPARADDA
jgi:hypothetical protein